MGQRVWLRFAPRRRALSLYRLTPYGKHGGRRRLVISDDGASRKPTQLLCFFAPYLERRCFDL